MRKSPCAVNCIPTVGVLHRNEPPYWCAVVGMSQVFGVTETSCLPWPVWTKLKKMKGNNDCLQQRCGGHQAWMVLLRAAEVWWSAGMDGIIAWNGGVVVSKHGWYYCMEQRCGGQQAWMVLLHGTEVWWSAGMDGIIA